MAGPVQHCACGRLRKQGASHHAQSASPTAEAKPPPRSVGWFWGSVYFGLE